MTEAARVALDVYRSAVRRTTRWEERPGSPDAPAKLEEARAAEKAARAALVAELVEQQRRVWAIVEEARALTALYDDIAAVAAIDRVLAGLAPASDGA